MMSVIRAIRAVRAIRAIRVSRVSRMPRLIHAIAIASVAAVHLVCAPRAAAQAEISGCKTSLMQGATQEMLQKEYQGKTERVLVLTGGDAIPVRVDCDQAQFQAEYIEIYQDRHLVIATRNVLFVSATNRISADRMEFDTQQKTGVFYNAFGTASLGERVDRSFFGTQEPDAMFRGREIHKIGPRKYTIVDGAFTSCVQPTPRWEMVTTSATFVLDDYALLKNSVLRVKGVPLMYMPIFYYPIQEDDRSTGFLMPTYGTSTIRGQSLSNYFFWAINRSQDATFEHDWFSKSGQGVAGEYRYVLGPGSQGRTNVSFLDEKDVVNEAGTVTQPGERSYRIDGSLVQRLGGSWRAQANANYFSSLAAQQLYQQDFFRATQSTRSFGGNIGANFREYVLTGVVDRTDFISGATGNNVTTYGGLPRVTFTRGERPIGKSRVYFGVTTEYFSILRSTTVDDVELSNQGLTRVDVNPAIRFPFTKWPFLTVNTAVGWRGTYWSESLSPINRAQVPESVRRQYFDFNTRITGPVFTRIFNRPERKFKHVIEPSFTIRRVTGFDVFDRIVQLDWTDNQVPDLFQVTYALTNRIYAKKDISREVLSVNVYQSRYSDARAAQLDPLYATSYSLQKANSKYSDVNLTVRGAPTDRIQVNFTTLWDPVAGAFLTYNANGGVNAKYLQAYGGWSQVKFINDRPTTGPVPETSSHYLTASTTWRTAQNHLGVTYSFHYDMLRKDFLQQRYFVYYNAQCCGVLAEYQTFNLAGVRTRVPQDKRFNLSFTLAGIGTFSNFLGAFGGQTGR
jgi:LPS-assembly protein